MSNFPSPLSAMGAGSGPSVEWEQVYSKAFGTLPPQDLLVTPTFDTHWTAGHTAAASQFEIVGGSGIEFIPNNGTNWTDSGSWTAPYFSAEVADLIGMSYSREDWISLIVKLTIGGNHTTGTLTDAMLNYGTSHAGLQNYRTEQRTNVQSSVFGGGIVRTWAGAQTGTGPSAPFGAHQTVLELQIRGGRVFNFTGTVFPSAPSQLTEVIPTTPSHQRYPLELRNPNSDYQYNPASDVVAISAYNFFGGTPRKVTVERLDIYHVDIASLGL